MWLSGLWHTCPQGPEILASGTLLSWLGIQLKRLQAQDQQEITKL